MPAEQCALMRCRDLRDVGGAGESGADEAGQLAWLSA